MIRLSVPTKLLVNSLLYEKMVKNKFYGIKEGRHNVIISHLRLLIDCALVLIRMDNI